jgi:RNA polymerase sigma-70 factor (ECF subfamily)
VIADAIRAALEALEDRPRSLLRWSLVKGWSIDRIAELYEVHRATAARWLSAARDALGEQIRKEVAARLSIPLDEVDSIVRLVQSQIDVSLLRIL